MIKDGRYTIRSAFPEDSLELSLLYHEVYRGKYPDKLMKDAGLIKAFILSPNNLWIVSETEGKLVASVLYEVDEGHRIAKVFGGLVLPEHRGADLLVKLMQYGAEYLHKRTDRVDVIYATTRTVNSAPQKITEKLGYKKLGIFPNVHKTDTYETHCLTALFCGDVLSKRFIDFKLHPELLELYKIVQNETGLPDLEVAQEEDFAFNPVVFKDKLPVLEIVNASEFVFHRFSRLREKAELPAHFYPFHRPNVLITSPCQDIELFLFLSELDTYCTIIGVKKPANYNFTEILRAVIALLRERNVRYIEIMVRVDKARTTNKVLSSGFIPSAYFPSFQLGGGVRYDVVLFSKTFETLDFTRLELEGVNRKFLIEYYKSWKKKFLSQDILKEV